MSDSSKSVVISGYYGFDNLGDEAILETLCRELIEIDPNIRICVLSQNPESTARKYNVKAINRWNISEIITSLSDAHLFVSGGGGLFQDTSSIKSVVYYAFLFLLARVKRVPIFVYAQGIGPLRSGISRFLTQASLSLASCICVRDLKSKKLVQSWNLHPHLTADPVWSLKMRSLGNDTNNGAQLKIGLSLRSSEVLTESWINNLTEALVQVLPENSILVPLILQESLDKTILDKVSQNLMEKGKAKGFSIKFPVSASVNDALPSQWLSEIASCDVVIAMRLHAVIMALKSGVPVLGLSYDQKVSAVTIEFEQPYIDMTDITSRITDKNIAEKIKTVLDNKDSLGKKAKQISGDKEKQARQNVHLLAKFLK